jgi:predicted metalloendopeptidase
VVTNLRTRLRSTPILAASLGLLISSCGSSTSPPQRPVESGATTATASPAAGSATATPAAGSAAAVAAYTPWVPPGAQVEDTTLAAVGLDADAIDKSVDPCDDFYQYACGNWEKSATIPDDKPEWMRSFVAIHERNEGYLHDILEKAASAPGNDPVLKKVGDYYAACMDETSINKLGLAPIKPLLGAIARVKDVKSLIAAIEVLHQHQIWVLWRFDATQDSKDATRMILGMRQGGLGLPERDYYLKDDPGHKKVLAAYQSYLVTMFGLAGEKPDAATQAAADTLAIETEIAKASMSRVELRDPQKTYNKIDAAGVAKALPHIPWAAYARAVGLAGKNDITVSSVSFFSAVDGLLGKFTPAQWQHYLLSHTLGATAELLPDTFGDTRFAFEQALTGQKERPVRWKRCVAATDGALGELLAQPFVKEHFSPDARAAAEADVHGIRAAFAANLGALGWMDDATKAKAEAKLDKVFYQIGYPDTWRKYTFAVGRTTYAQNSLASDKFELARDLGKIGKPVDKNEWGMSPPTVNAYYDPQLNKMVFPAGILQPPFFSPDANLPVNMGGMGVVVGHELTHGFDDQGSQYDADGNLKNWWSDAVGTQFRGKTQCIDDQYAKYEAVPGARLNGKLTLGENIADNGGLKLAFAAYRAMRADAKVVKRAGGYDEDQQFFLGFAQAWCAKVRPEFAQLLVNVDPHSPPRWRVDGTLSNSDAFATAFQCKVGARMHPPAACHVW